MSEKAELLALGFEKRAAYDEPRLSEIVEMYEEMGFEVRLAFFEPSDESGCTECMKLDPKRFKIIYTRKKGD